MEKTIKKLGRDEKGFTLVELAVVMIIIGVLIGGVLKGQEMITNARVTTTAAELESFQAAMNAFQDKYNSFPGDMASASTRIAGCATQVLCNTESGNGNGRLETGLDDATADEALEFFGQLAAAGYISGVSGNAAAFAAGVTNPNGKLPSTIYKVADAADGVGNFTYASTSRHYIILDGITDRTAASSGRLDNLQASTIDRKLDDGNPQSGVVLGQNLATDCVFVFNSSSYDETDLNKLCAIAYRL